MLSEDDFSLWGDDNFVLTEITFPLKASCDLFADGSFSSRLSVQVLYLHGATAITAPVPDFSSGQFHSDATRATLEHKA